MLEGPTNYISDMLFSCFPVTKYVSCYTRRFHQLWIFHLWDIRGHWVENEMLETNHIFAISGVICRYTCSFSAGATTTTPACYPHQTTFLSPAIAEGSHSVIPFLPTIGMHGEAQWPRRPTYYSTKVALMTVVRILTAHRMLQHPQFLMPLSYPIVMPAQFLLNIWPPLCFLSTARPVVDAVAQVALSSRIIITLNWTKRSVIWNMKKRSCYSLAL